MRHKAPKSYSIHFFAALIISLAVQGLYPAQLQAQQDVALDLILQPNLNKAQVLSISNIGIRQSSGGPPLFNIVIGNEGTEPLNNLYLEMQLSSNKYGQIVTFHQRAGYPFSLSPGERVIANSNQLQDGLPGVEEPVRFDGELTQGGENFFNNLANSTTIPPDIYTLQITIHYGNSSRSGGELIASAEATFGENISVDSSVDLYLLQPGGEVRLRRSDQLFPSLLPMGWPHRFVLPAHRCRR
ncbi:MAG: hypothetical protein U5K69_15480 [Balneolaceae bacterium]|nr:hypothetical protein [Balneolaceae bacterium]